MTGSEETVRRSRRRRAALLVVLLLLFSTGAAALYDGLSGESKDAGPPATPSAERPPVTATQQPTLTARPSPDPTRSSTPPTPTATSTPRPIDDVSLTVTGEETLSVHSDTGEVRTLRGQVYGSLSWKGEAVDTVALIVQTWVPERGWRTTERTQLVADGPIDIREALGSPVSYVTEPRSDAFDNYADGTTEHYYGAVAVTAVLFDEDGEERRRVTERFEYTLFVDNVRSDAGTGDVALDLGVGGGDGDTTVTDDGLLGRNNGVPGSQYASTIDLANSGEDRGSVFLDVSYVSFESGIVNEAEAAADSTGGDPGQGAGELHEAFELRAAVVTENGSLRYVVGNESSYRELTEIADSSVELTDLAAGETVQLRIEYRIDPDAGNRIQSDTIDLEFAFHIQQG